MNTCGQVVYTMSPYVLLWCAGHYTPHYLLLVTAVDVGDNIVTGAGCGRAHCAPPDTSDTRTAPDTVLFLLPGHFKLSSDDSSPQAAELVRRKGVAVCSV